MDFFKATKLSVGQSQQWQKCNLTKGRAIENANSGWWVKMMLSQLLQKQGEEEEEEDEQKTATREKYKKTDQKSFFFTFLFCS